MCGTTTSGEARGRAERSLERDRARKKRDGRDADFTIARRERLRDRSLARAAAQETPVGDLLVSRYESLCALSAPCVSSR